MATRFLVQEDRMLLGRKRSFFEFNPTWQVVVERAIALFGTPPPLVSALKLEDYMRATQILKVVLATEGRYATLLAINEASTGISRQAIADRLGVLIGQIDWNLKELENANIIKHEDLQTGGPNPEPRKKYRLVEARMQSISYALASLQVNTYP